MATAVSSGAKLGKVAVVVGVGPGAGSAIARKFADQKYQVALVSRRLEPLQAIETEIKRSGGQAVSIAADTGNEVEVKAAYKKIVDSFGSSPEVLVYNAGPGGVKWPPPSLLNIRVEEFAQGFSSGVTGALIWLQQVLPQQLAAGKGTVIFTGATASLRGGPKFATLAAPKFALRALAQSAAREYQSSGIHISHVIIDGIIDSPKYRSAFPDRPQGANLAPEAIAEEYWKLHTQHSSAWTHELDLRPISEKF